MSDISVEYRGEKITYSESSNTWMWQGSNRGLISLEATKKSIDKALDGSPDKPKFTLRPAIFGDYHNYADATVTSQDGGEYWITYEERQSRGKPVKKRKKTYASSLYADTPANRAKIQEMEKIAEEREALSEKQNDIAGSLESFSDWLKEQV